MCHNLALSYDEMRLSEHQSVLSDIVRGQPLRIKILEEMARLLYREWFVEYRSPGHERVRMVDSAVGKVPEGWEVKRLGEVSSHINRGVSPVYYEEGEYVVLNQKCVRDGKVSFEPSRRGSRVPAADRIVRHGDILINSTGEGTLGRVAQVCVEPGSTTVDSHVTIVRPAATVNLNYLGYTMMLLEPKLSRMGEGATNQTELSRQRISDLPMLCPPKSSQDAFGEHVGPVREAITTLSRAIANLRRTRDLLLPKLIPGEITLPNPIESL